MWTELVYLVFTTTIVYVNEQNFGKGKIVLKELHDTLVQQRDSEVGTILVLL